MVINHNTMREEIKKQEATPRQIELTKQVQRRMAGHIIRERGMLCTIEEYLAECKRRSNGETPQLDDKGRKIQ
jgi:hypothetical protein